MSFLNSTECGVVLAISAEFARAVRGASTAKAEAVKALSPVIVDAFGRRNITQWLADGPEWEVNDCIPELRKRAISTAFDELMVQLVNGMPECVDEVTTDLHIGGLSIDAAQYRAYVKSQGKRKNKGEKKDPLAPKSHVKTFQNLLSTLFGDLGFAQRKPKARAEMTADKLAEAWSKADYDLDLLVAAMRLFAVSTADYIPAEVMLSADPDSVLEVAATILEARDRKATRNEAAAMADIAAGKLTLAVA